MLLLLRYVVCDRVLLVSLGAQRARLRTQTEWPLTRLCPLEKGRCLIESLQTGTSILPLKAEAYLLQRRRYRYSIAIVMRGPGEKTQALRGLFKYINITSSKDQRKYLHDNESSPSPTRQLSSKLCRSYKPLCALIIRSPPNLCDEAIEGFSTISCGAFCGCGSSTTICLFFSNCTQGDASIDRRRT